AQSRAVLTAVVAAAKADGHIDEQEHAAIDAELDKLGDDPEAQHWLRRQIARPLDAAEVAAAADSDVVAAERYLASRRVIAAEAQNWLRGQIARPLDAAEVAAAADSDVVAAEMYLASRMVIDTENDRERAYLDDLARQLRLDPDLRARLDREAEQATRH